MRLVSLALLSAVLPAAAAASPTPEVAVGQVCAGSRFITCAGVQVRYARLGDAGVSQISIRGAGSLAGQQATASFARPDILSIIWDADGRAKECRPGGLDCRLVDAVTTPEPMTMVLLATGLVGLAGVTGLRRWGQPI